MSKVYCNLVNGVNKCLLCQVSAAPEGKSLVLRVEKTGRIGRYLREPRRAAARNELVFLDESPDYCKEDLANDVLGPRGRECGLKCDM